MNATRTNASTMLSTCVISVKLTRPRTCFRCGVTWVVDFLWQGGLWDTITAREHIEIYAGVKCLPDQEVKSRATAVLTALDMLKHADKQVKELSGGTPCHRKHLSF